MAFRIHIRIQFRLWLELVNMVEQIVPERNHRMSRYNKQRVYEGNCFHDFL